MRMPPHRNAQRHTGPSSACRSSPNGGGLGPKGSVAWSRQSSSLWDTMPCGGDTMPCGSTMPRVIPCRVGYVPLRVGYLRCRVGYYAVCIQAANFAESYHESYVNEIRRALRQNLEDPDEYRIDVVLTARRRHCSLPSHLHHARVHVHVALLRRLSISALTFSEV
jgi:hypothetical protein